MTILSNAESGMELVYQEQWNGKHHFRVSSAEVAAPGRRVFGKEFIKNIQWKTRPVPKKIKWLYAEWQPAYKDMTGIEFIEGIPTDLNLTGEPTLLIIDDLMQETDSRITKLFTKGSHHRNVSVMYIVQNIFSKNKEHRTISLNAQYIVLFKNPRDATQIEHLARQMYPGKTAYMREAFKDATQRSYGYLVIDLRQETPDHARLRTNIFPPEYETVYVQK